MTSATVWMTGSGPAGGIIGHPPGPPWEAATPAHDAVGGPVAGLRARSSRSRPGYRPGGSPGPPGRAAGLRRRGVPAGPSPAAPMPGTGACTAWRMRPPPSAMIVVPPTRGTPLSCSGSPADPSGLRWMNRALTTAVGKPSWLTRKLALPPSTSRVEASSPRSGAFRRPQASRAAPQARSSCPAPRTGRVGRALAPARSWVAITSACLVGRGSQRSRSGAALPNEPGSADG